jgi:catechol 2,3-dioxygenase-like lactoylglutathione lyase family enzyme
MAIATPQVVPPPKEEVPVPESQAPLRLGGCDHMAFSVPDLVAAERWYIDVMGAELISRYNWGGETAHAGAPPHVDLRIGKDVVSLFPGDPLASATGVPRHYHYAFTCGSLAELEQWQAYLRSKGVNLRNNGAVHGHPGFGAVSLYFEDPWGCKLEIVTWLADYATAEAEVIKRDGVIMGGGGHRRARDGAPS